MNEYYWAMHHLEKICEENSEAKEHLNVLKKLVTKTSRYPVALEDDRIICTDCGAYLDEIAEYEPETCPYCSRKLKWNVF